MTSLAAVSKRSLLPAARTRKQQCRPAVGGSARHSTTHAGQPLSRQASRPGRSCLHVRRFRESDLDTELEEADQLGMPAARAIPGLQARAKAPATLPTVFRLGHACKPGERLGVMGDCEQLGAWRKAVLMKWTEADVWTVAVNLPKGAHVAYKFITLGPRHRFTGYVEEEHDPGSSNLKVHPSVAKLHGTSVEVMEHYPCRMRTIREQEAAAAASAGDNGGSVSTDAEEEVLLEEPVAAAVPDAGPKMLPAVFRLAHHCEFGERYGLLGSSEELGAWDPARAVPMQWEGNDMWMVEVPLTVGQEVKYKFVLLTEDGRMLRQCEEVQREYLPGKDFQVRVQPGAYRQWGSSAHVLPELPTHLNRYLDHPVRRV